MSKAFPVQINFQVSEDDGAALEAVRHLFNGSRAAALRACIEHGLAKAVKSAERVRTPRQAGRLR